MPSFTISFRLRANQLRLLEFCTWWLGAVQCGLGAWLYVLSSLVGTRRFELRQLVDEAEIALLVHEWCFCASSLIGGIVRSKIAAVAMPLIKRVLAGVAILSTAAHVDVRRG